LDGWYCGRRDIRSVRSCRYPAFDGGGSGWAVKGPSEGSPLDRQGQARFAGVQPCTPASHPASFIHHNGGRTAGVGDEPEQLRPRPLLPASDAGTLRLIPDGLHVCHFRVSSCLYRSACRPPLPSGSTGAGTRWCRPL